MINHDYLKNHIGTNIISFISHNTKKKSDLQYRKYVPLYLPKLESNGNVLIPVFLSVDVFNFFLF